MIVLARTLARLVGFLMCVVLALGGLLLAVTETHHQIQVNHDRSHDHLKAGFGFPKISALTNPPSHQPGNPMFDDNAFA